jgi:glycosyltransferase involved in cell wall biosynthesis
MRIALIVTRLEQLGPVIVMQTLVNCLSIDRSLDLKVFYLKQPVDPNIKILAPVEQLDLKKFRFHDFDLIQTSGIRPDLFAFWNRRKIKYHVSTIHNLVFEDLTFTYNKLISYIFGNLWLILWTRADKLVCLSKSMKDYYSRWFSPDKLEVIFNGISVRNQSVLPDEDVIQVVNNYRKRGLKIVGTIGMLTRRKGIDQILYALADMDGIALVIIGSGKELENLIHLAKKLKIIDRCLFCGYRSNAICYYNFFDIYISSSRSEGFGLTLAEAASEKIPIICSDIAVFMGLFNTAEVIFYKLNDVSSLKLALSTSIDVMKEKSGRAYERYKTDYTDKKMAEKYYKLFHSVN